MIMSTSQHERPVLSESPSPRLIGLGVFFLVAAIALTPQLLIRLGPMRQSLTSQQPLVRQMAHLEVSAGRGLFVLASIVFFGLFPLWKKVRVSRPMRAIGAHRISPVLLSVPDRQIHFSSYLVLAVAALTVAFDYSAKSLFRFGPETIKLIFFEDGLIENATPILFALNALLAGLMSWRIGGRHRTTLILLGTFFFLCLMEEISWGQRVFGFKTTGIMAGLNVQNEVNLHNFGGYLADHIFMVLVFLYGFVVPLLCLRSVFWQRLFDMLGLPVASRGLAIAMLVISFLQPWTVYRIFGQGINVQEEREFLTAMAFLALMGESWIKVQRSRQLS